MMPSSNQGVGMDIGFPDVCLTPAAPSPVPIPYPNLGSNSMALPFTPTILLSFCPGHNQSAKAMMTNGDNGGVAHSSCMMSGSNTLGNPRILLQGMPAETLCNPMTGNNYNCALDAKLVPSATNCLMGYCQGTALDDLAAELLDAPALGAPGWTLEREGAGWRALHVRRGGRAARAGARQGDLVLGVTPAQVRVRRPGERGERALRWRAPAVTPAVRAALGADGVGRLSVRRCSLGAPAAAARALAALEAAGARALVLDLRGNPGGDVGVAVALAGLFLGGGAVVARVEGAALEATSTRAPSALPLVALLDGGTASSAEVLAAALADHDRAVLTGATTFGKSLATPVAVGAHGPVVARGPAVRLRRASGAALGPLLPAAPARDLFGAVRLARRLSLRRPR